MESGVICILGTEKHSQVAAVRDALSSQGVGVALIDYESSRSLSVEVSEDGTTAWRYAHSDLALAPVLWAADKFIFQRFGQTEAWAENYARLLHWKETAQSLLRCFPNLVVNSPARVAAAQSKLWQLQAASESGLQVPPTLVTNDPCRIRDWSGGGELIVKAIGDPHLPRVHERVEQVALMTCDLTPDMLEGRIETEPHPLFVQKKIEKRFEYRVVIVGNAQFAFRIDPSQHPIMATDYRRGGYMVEYLPDELPPPIEARLRHLHAALGLFSGCYDLIQTPDSEFVFLEVNPSGIWAKHDTILGGAISKTFARCLVDLAADVPHANTGREEPQLG